MELKKHFETCLKRSLPYPSRKIANKLLYEAMAYALFGSAKRMRPLMLLEVAHTILPSSRAYKLAMPAALAIEYVHAYSLIHDDLPCMDDDDYRRGKPSVHRQFGEAVAVLTGDALLSDAFGLLAQASYQPAKQCLILSQAIGSTGMVLGQVDDVISTEKNRETLINKTAKLFECAYRLGAISVGATFQQEEEVAQRGLQFGFQFQLEDDRLDGEFCAFPLPF